MAIVIKNIIPRKHAENAQTTQYTAINCKTLIDKFTVTNTGSSNADISVNLVASAGSAAAPNLVLDSRTLVPDETYTCPELVGQLLESGGFISTLASVATTLTISATGREIT